MNKELHLFFREISRTKFFGFLPADWLLHIVIGLLLYSLFIRFIDKKKSFYLVFLISCLKELFDSQTKNSNLTEHLFDIFFTVLPAIIFLIKMKIKSKKD